MKKVGIIVMGCFLGIVIGILGTRLMSQSIVTNILQQKENEEYNGFYYAQLDDDEKNVYNEIMKIMLNHDKSCTVSTSESTVLERAYKAAIGDNGGLFWVKGYDYIEYPGIGSNWNLKFIPTYTMSFEQRRVYQEAIDQKVESILKELGPNASEYEKAKYIFDYLTENIDYDMSAEENQTIISAFIYQRTICQGYSNATQYLLDKIGIECCVVIGEINGQAHSWNLVKLDDEYYYIDTTIGNSNYSDIHQNTTKYTNYIYFAITTSELVRTHKIISNYILPICTATKNNYFIKEGLYFNDWDKEKIGDAIKRQYESGNTAISLKFSNREIYNYAIQYLLKEEHILDYCKDAKSLYYINDPIQNCIVIDISEY